MNFHMAIRALMAQRDTNKIPLIREYLKYDDCLLRFSKPVEKKAGSVTYTESLVNASVPMYRTGNTFVFRTRGIIKWDARTFDQIDDSNTMIKYSMSYGVDESSHFDEFNEFMELIARCEHISAKFLSENLAKFGIKRSARPKYTPEGIIENFNYGVIKSYGDEDIQHIPIEIRLYKNKANDELFTNRNINVICEDGQKVKLNNTNIEELLRRGSEVAIMLQFSRVLMANGKMSLKFNVKKIKILRGGQADDDDDNFGFEDNEDAYSSEDNF